MKPNVPPHFKCIACTKVYRWKPDMAGRKVLCACGLIMRAAKTPDGKPVSIGHRAPVVKPSEARVHARVGENAVIPEWAEESCTVQLGSSDVLVDDFGSAEPASDADLCADTKTYVPVVSRPEAPAPRPVRPGSAAGIKPDSNAALKTVAAGGPKMLAPDKIAASEASGVIKPGTDGPTCPNCKGSVRVGAILCVQCGTALTNTGASTSPSTQQTSGGIFSRVIQAVVGNKPGDK